MKKPIIALLALSFLGGCVTLKDLRRQQKDLRQLRNELRKTQKEIKDTQRVVVDNNFRNAALGFRLMKQRYSIVLADAYAKFGKLRKALRHYNNGIQDLSQHKYYRRSSYLGEARYNRACVYARMGKVKEAMNDLEWADKKGWLKRATLRKFFFWKDKDLKSLHSHPKYKELVEKWQAWWKAEQVRQKAYKLARKHYNKASKLALKGKKAEALAELMWLDRTGHMELIMIYAFRFWRDSDFDNLKKEPQYIKLVAKWKAWYKVNKKKCRG